MFRSGSVGEDEFEIPTEGLMLQGARIERGSPFSLLTCLAIGPELHQ